MGLLFDLADEPDMTFNNKKVQFSVIKRIYFYSDFLKFFYLQHFNIFRKIKNENIEKCCDSIIII